MSSSITDDCKDDNEWCPTWAAEGECSANPAYMLQSCKKSCEVCKAGKTLLIPIVQIWKSDFS